MNADEKTADEGETRGYQDLNDARVSKLMRLGIRSTPRLVEQLMERVDRGGGAWLDSLLAEEEIATLADASSLDELRASKNRGKEQLAAASDQDDRSRATLQYFLAIGAALYQHGALITSRPRAELEPILLDLAATLPDPWSRWLGRAAVAPEAL